MPTCCYSCRFSKFPFDGNKNPYCTILLKGIDLPRFDRPDWCPLIEEDEQEPIIVYEKLTARWRESNGFWGNKEKHYFCTNCNTKLEVVLPNGDEKLINPGLNGFEYCPYCGAIMDLGSEYEIPVEGGCPPIEVKDIKGVKDIKDDSN